MDAVVAYVLPLLVFLAVYALLLRHAKRRGQQPQPDARKWLALIVVFAALAALVGVLTGH